MIYIIEELLGIHHIMLGDKNLNILDIIVLISIIFGR